MERNNWVNGVLAFHLIIIIMMTMMTIMTTKMMTLMTTMMMTMRIWMGNGTIGLIGCLPFRQDSNCNGCRLHVTRLKSS